MAANVLIVAIDGLRASALGAYGNTSFATPALDRFAADSMLFDWCYGPSADLVEIYRALWNSQHPARPLDLSTAAAGEQAVVSLPRAFAERGYTTTLVTDEPALRSLPAAADFDEVAPVLSAPESNAPIARAAEISTTEFARLFAEATEIIDRSGQPQLLWLHARGMYGAWDAPLALQQSLLDEGDPPPVDALVSPDFEISKGDDPDAAFRYACAYAAQVMVLDACWENFMAALNAAGENQWLVMLLGARGFPLGEHGRIGGVDSRLYGDALHVPWLIQFPGHLGHLARSEHLASHLDVLPTFIDWLDRDRALERPLLDGMCVLPLASTARAPWRNATVSTSATARAIRTAAWCLREDLAAPDRAELYVRPDDRWEANDVAKLCPEVVEELRAAMIDTSSRMSPSAG